MYDGYFETEEMIQRRMDRIRAQAEQIEAAKEAETNNTPNVAVVAHEAE